MPKSLVRRFKESSHFLRLTLSLLPSVVWLCRGGRDAARLAYRIYSIIPLTLAANAALSAERVAAVARHPFDRKLLQMVSARFSFDQGDRLDHWEASTHAALSAADEALEHDISAEEVADLIFEALQLLFHPSIHQSTRPSPFVDSPATTMELMEHECVQRLLNRHATPRRTHKPGNVVISGRPTNVLVLTDTNLNFMGPILENLESDPAVTLRIRDLSQEDIDPSWWHPRNTIIDRITNTSPPAPEALSKDLTWADVIFVEWSQALAARLSGVNLNAALVVRLHKYEAFIPTPSLTQWTNVDSLITITPYMSKVLARTVPGISDATTIRLVPNVTDLRRFVLPKQPSASRTIGLIQYSSIVKDPLWALDVLELLLKRDPEWKLVCVGSPYISGTNSEASNRYFEQFQQRVQELGGSVEFLGRRSDLDQVFRDIGVILSSSTVEGAPVSIQEGLASGALPVIRNWPILKAVQATESLYPAEWIVETPEDAATRILDWAKRAENPVNETSSRAWAIDGFDSMITMPMFKQTILGSAAKASEQCEK